MERLVMDPPEFIENRTELSLSGLGLEVVQAGVDWGESQVELQLARQQIGESATNRHLTNVAMTIPLRVQKESGVKLAEAAYKLQQKVGLWQQEGGWIRRDFDVDGKFAGSVGYRVIGASLSGLQGWMFAHRQSAPEVSLKLIRGPLCYATTEIEGSEVKGSEVRDLQWELPEVKGTAPGLLRLRVKNEGATDWRGLVSSIESRDYSAGETALPVYDAEKLTLRGPGEVKERTGASGGKVVRATVSYGWQAILDSEIAGVGAMSHKGVRRLQARIYDSNASVGLVQLRLEWRALGASNWSQNSIVSSPIVGNFQIVDLGECRPEPATIGNRLWEWKVLARAPGGAATIDIDRVYPLAAEQMLTVSEGGEDPIDGEPERLPGTVAQAQEEGSGATAWVEPEKVKVKDASAASITLAKGTTSKWIKPTNFGFAIPTASTIVSVSPRVACRVTKGGIVGKFRLIVAGVLGAELGTTSLWPGGSEYPFIGPAASSPSLTPAQANASTFGVALEAVESAGTESVGQVDAITIVIAYLEEADEKRVCFASRSVELRSDGIFRQAPAEEVWGRSVPEGFYHYASASGLEGRPMRGIVVPTQGDFSGRADVNANKISVKPTYRPAFHFARESS